MFLVLGSIPSTAVNEKKRKEKRKKLRFLLLLKV